MMKKTFKFIFQDLECYYEESNNNIVIPSKDMVLSFDKIQNFKHDNFKRTLLGYCIVSTGLTDIKGSLIINMIHIGCLQTTKEEFNKFYNLILYKKKQWKLDN